MWHQQRNVGDILVWSFVVEFENMDYTVKYTRYVLMDESHVSEGNC